MLTHRDYSQKGAVCCHRPRQDSRREGSVAGAGTSTTAAVCPTHVIFSTFLGVMLCASCGGESGHHAAGFEELAMFASHSKLGQ
jgi:hypothetical protein